MDSILHIGASPPALALSILISTFFLEDAAIGYAALIAASGSIAPPFAFATLFAGIYVGDLGLYVLGAAARNNAWARKRVGEERIAWARGWLCRRAVLTLIGARAVPGSRLPVYAASGFLRVPFALFAVVTGAASLIWTAGLFGGIYAFGMQAASLFGPFKYVAGGVFAAILLGVPLLSARAVGRSAPEAGHV